MSQSPPPTQPPHPTAELGFHGAVRFKVAPVVELVPSNDAVTIDTLRPSPVSLKGTVKNLTESVECRLEWTVLVDVDGPENAKERTVAHPRPTALVPSGSSYEIKEKGASEGVFTPLSVDPFELNLIGTGTLGYTVQLQMIGKPSCSVPSATSKLQVDLPFTVTVKAEESKPTGEPTDREAESQAPGTQPLDAIKAAAQQALFADQAEGQRAFDQPLLIGKMVTVEVLPAKAFIGCLLTLHLAEYSTEGEEIEGTRSTFTWTPTLPDKQRFSWRVGMVSRGDSHALSTTTGEGLRSFRWSAAAARPGPPSSGAPVQAPAPAVGSQPAQPAAVMSSAVEFCTAQHPTLLTLNLAERAASTTDATEIDAVVTATFEGLDPSLVFDMDLDVMVKTETRIVPLSKVLGEVERTDDEVRCSARVTMGALSVPVFRLSACRHALTKLDAELRFFAVISFGSAAVSGAAVCVFNSVAGYVPNLESERNESGFAPFTGGWLTRPEIATGVCTDLMTLDGKSEDLAGSAAVPQPLWPEYRVFLCTVFGEGGVSTELSWRGVAHTILNRRNTTAVPGGRHWTSIEKVVSAPGQFEAYQKEQYKLALAYFERRYIKKDLSQSDQTIARIEDVVISLFMAAQGPPTEGFGKHNGWGVTYFFSPAAQAKLNRESPTWAQAFEELTHFFTPRGGTNKDFRFFRNK